MILSYDELQVDNYIYYMAAGNSSSRFADVPLPRYGIIQSLMPNTKGIQAYIYSPFTFEEYQGHIENFFRVSSDEAYHSLAELQSAHPKIFI